MSIVNVFWLTFAIFIFSLITVKFSNLNSRRSIAKIVASLSGSVIGIALVGLAYIIYSGSTCNAEVDGFYESKEELCYGKKEISTLTGKSNGEITPIIKFAILDKDKAIIYPKDMNAHIIYAEYGQLAIAEYDTYMHVQNLR